MPFLPTKKLSLSSFVTPRQARKAAENAFDDSEKGWMSEKKVSDRI
jgi:hypothetical protein